jgi:hypothetical protein
MQSVVTTNNTGGLGWYYITDATGDAHWNVYYRWLNNIREMEKQAVALNEPNYRAIAKTLKSWMYSILVDSFGDIPMSEATRGDEGIFTPKFDKQIEVYKKQFFRIRIRQIFCLMKPPDLNTIGRVYR